MYGVKRAILFRLASEGEAMDPPVMDDMPGRLSPAAPGA
jgi:hypothetical protein